MDEFASIGEAIDAIVKFDREKFAAMPDHVQRELTRLSGVGINPAQRIMQTAEVLFANRDKLTRNVDRKLVARLMQFAVHFGQWQGAVVDQRGEKIAAVMFGEAGGQPVAEADVPAPRDDFVAPATAN